MTLGSVLHSLLDESGVVGSLLSVSKDSPKKGAKPTWREQIEQNVDDSWSKTENKIRCLLSRLSSLSFLTPTVSCSSAASWLKEAALSAVRPSFSSLLCYPTVNN